MNRNTCGHVQPVAIYSNMTHFNVGHFDEVSVCSNGDIGDSKWTWAWTNGHNADTLTAKRVKGMSNLDNPPMPIRH